MADSLYPHVQATMKAYMNPLSNKSPSFDKPVTDNAGKRKRPLHDDDKSVNHLANRALSGTSSSSSLPQPVSSHVGTLFHGKV